MHDSHSRHCARWQSATDKCHLCSIGLESTPTPSQLRKLDLLANTVKESIRMYHPLGLNIREARTNAILPVGGDPERKEPIAVSKGQIIVYSVAGLQRNPSFYGPTAHI